MQLTHWACLHISLLKRGAEFLNHFLEYDCLNPCFHSNLLPTHLVKPSLASRYKENYSLRHTKFSMGHSSQDLIPVNPSEISKWISKIIMEHLFYFSHLRCLWTKLPQSEHWMYEKRANISFYMILRSTYFKVKVKNIRLHQMNKGAACFDQHSKITQIGQDWQIGTMRVPEGDLHCQCILSIFPAGTHQFYAICFFISTINLHWALADSNWIIWKLCQSPIQLFVMTWS